VCIEARELVIALPEEYLSLNANRILKKFTDFFKEKYGVECIAALHHNTRQTNYHIHLIFSERKELPEPEVKIATRNMFYDENGKHRRTKKEILNDQGELRKGCYIISKGEPYSGHYFGQKNSFFKKKAFLRELKVVYTELINEEIYDERRTLKVFSKDSIFLATKKIGKNNPMGDVIRKNNEAVQKWNFNASYAATIMSKDHVKEVKRQMVLKPIRESEAAGNGPELYRGIVQLATKTLNRLIKEWVNIFPNDRPKPKDEMFGKMISYCRDRVSRVKEKEEKIR